MKVTSPVRFASAVTLLTQLACSSPVERSYSNGPDLGSFKDPSARSRPRFRYWIPDASVNLSTVRQDIADAGAVGAGGVELLGYYDYGDIAIAAGPIPTDWTKYGWGTPAWRSLQDAALEATKENNLIIDLALGPNQGAGVPAPLDTDGLQWDLQPFNVSVPGNSFNAMIPGWGTGPLVSASIGLVTKIANVSSVVTTTLSEKTLQDVTSKVSKNGHLDLKFPSHGSGQHYMVFAYYLIHTDYRELQSPELVSAAVTQSPVTNYVQNGSFVVDHFSAKGAEVVADFWNSHLVNGGSSRELIKEVGEFVWEDSQEYPSNLFWTPSVPKAFQKQHGYSINKYLPLLLPGNSGSVGTVFDPRSPDNFVTDEADGGLSHVTDYRQTMTELNKDYLNAITTFAHSLGVKSSSQVGYNFELDMLANIPLSEAPECETLGFGHLIDGYRQFAGPADLAGRNIISSEAGAIEGKVFQQTIPELLWDLKRSFAGGVNAYVLHGMPFTGYYPDTTWPTYTTFSYLFSEMHNRHQPAWDFYRDWIDYVARLMKVMQTGTPKVDLVFWLKNTNFESVPSHYTSDDLVKAGYTYEYLSPDNFDLPNAYVQRGVLAPKAQSFKAMVVQANDTLTVAGVNKLAEWVYQGFTVIFLDGLPSTFSGTNSAYDIKGANAKISRICSLQNVHQVKAGGLPQALASIGIKPRTSIASTSEDLWYTRWRESSTETLVYVYHDAAGVPPGSQPASKKTITFANSGSPYFYDAWSGEQTPITDYTHTGSSVTIPLTLAGNQTTLIAFRAGGARPTPYKSPQSSHQQKKSISVSNWKLIVESWTAPKDLSIEGTVKTNTTYHKIPYPLVPWNEISSALTNTSGRGYYTSSFTTTSSKAVITLGPILHSAVLYVNGHRTAPLDVTAPVVDISSYLLKGTNKIEVVSATPLGNAVYPIKSQLVTANTPEVAVEATGIALVGPGGLFTLSEYGLIGEVVVETS